MADGKKESSSSPLLRARLLSQFTCLGERCEDTCCQNWSMQVDNTTLERYKNEAPELLAAVEPGIDTPWLMRKDETSGYCVKFDGGLCGIHKTHGERFLGDACHFYPRITRRLGEQVVMAATMSCPEVARLALQGEQPCDLQEATADRLPHGMKQYLPDGLTAQEALSVHRAFLAAAEETSVTPERAFLRIASVSRSIERIDRASWPDAVPFYLENADARLPEAETDIADPFNLLHALCGLVVAAQRPLSPRLRRTVADIEKALDARLDWQQVLILTGNDSHAAWQRLRAGWNGRQAPVLRRWLQMQLALALYPFSGLGATLTERITIIGVRLATVRLALMSHAHLYGQDLPPEETVRIMQSLARLLDHLGDPDFSLRIYGETGWTREARMRGLLEI